VYKAPERMAIDMKVMAQLETLPAEVLASLADARTPVEFQAILAGSVGDVMAAEVMGVAALPAPASVRTEAHETVDAEEVEISGDAPPSVPPNIGFAE
jgi:hypothetical protein